MSDFTSNFWSVFVTALTLVGIIGCAVLLWMAGRKKVVSTADNTTGHVWDEDLVEMNNPLPRWWVWMFVITIIFGLGYLAAYPGLGSSAGKLGWSREGRILRQKWPRPTKSWNPFTPALHPLPLKRLPWTRKPRPSVSACS